ncbi:hypothetical protein HD553DRAFT_322172 [Filobasidium floriforme]|uniref:uncharacterized protein n=1 Tax=Filobasidium floriforme TaxID=5210 RepID=UPI001E8D2B8F|nr:uncharacterized protein HD553DRAFT_322172 [Filobasidium floriforme]KAH8089374.1 hypothetical protein HD553DRAFT_322172 [Filobasidium floriforme]
MYTGMGLNEFTDGCRLNIIRRFVCLRVPHRIGLSSKGELTVTWVYMPLSIVPSFMSTNNTEDGVPADVGAARPGELDPDIDFWAFGIILLEHQREAYCQKSFEVRDLVPDLSHEYLNLLATSRKAQSGKS